MQSCFYSQIQCFFLCLFETNFAIIELTILRKIFILNRVKQMCKTAEETMLLFQKGQKPYIVIAEEEYPQVLRACGDLQKDLFRVTGYSPEIVHRPEEAKGEIPILIGTLERNPMLQTVFANCGYEKENRLNGKECYSIFKALLPETQREALFILGSDMRGCIYGIYRLSFEIGVSPFYWWADVTPQRKLEIRLQNLPIHTAPPSVEYRGIFINDERNFQLWGKQFENPEEACFGSPNPKVYAKVFELLLRLHANTLWPAMHPYSTAFNKYTDENGLPYNAKLAEEYGIIIGTSHCENMLRNNVGEWKDWAEAEKKKTHSVKDLQYDYSVNPKAVLKYWEERVRQNKDFENIFTLGMRGIHDGSMSLSKIPKPKLEDKIRITNEIIKLQREMLRNAYGSEDGAPQIFVPYKEAAELYNGDPKHGIAGIDLPEDITLMWSDDNHGYIRQFPNAKERARKGGNGVYYHVSYWGYPCSYLWINSTPLGMIHREFTKAFESGIQKIFIVNVGDIKPAEISLAFQMYLLYDMHFETDTVKKFLVQFAKSTYLLDEARAIEFFEVVTEYYRLAVTLRPEFLGKYDKTDFDGKSIYSIIHNFDEATQVLSEFDALQKKSEALKSSITETLQDAYYEMIHYAICSAYAVLQHHIYWQKYQLSALQHRKGSCEMYRELSEKAYAQMQSHVRYYNETLQDGKWNKIMDPYPPAFKENKFVPLYRVPQIAPKRSYPKMKFSFFKRSGIGASVQDDAKGKANLTLQFDNLCEKPKFIDVFSCSGNRESYTISHADYLDVSGYTGSVKTEERLFLSPNWEKLPQGETNTKIRIQSAKRTIEYRLTLQKYPKTYPQKTHVESNGVVSIPACKFQTAEYLDAMQFLENPGRSENAVLFCKKDAGASLKYAIYFHSTGEFTLELCRIPTLNEGFREDGTPKSCSVSVSVDDAAPKVLYGCNECYKKVKTWLEPKEAWRNNVYRHIEYVSCKIKIKKSGLHTITVGQREENIAITNLIVYTKGERNSYTIPPESYNTF